MKILEPLENNSNHLKNLEFQTRLWKIMQNHRISFQNNENFENLRIPFESQKK